MRMDI